MKLSLLDPLVVPKGQTSGGALRTAIAAAAMNEKSAFEMSFIRISLILNVGKMLPNPTREENS